MRGLRHVLVVLTVAAATIAPIGTAAAATGTLSGQVVDASGTPLAGICVSVHPAGQLASYEQTTTDSTGRYTFELDRGSYQVEFSDCDGAANGIWAQEWYDDASHFADAQAVSVTTDAVTTADAALARGGSIRGAVVESTGAGIGGACVTAFDSRHPDVRNTATADSRGAFRVAGLRPGEYVLMASDCADVPADQAKAFYGPGGTVARGAGDAARLAVTAGGTTTIDQLVLPDAATLTGRLLDGDGAAVAGICVVASDVDSSTSVGTRTDSGGHYRLGGLLPGRWTVKASDCRDGVTPRNAFATVYLLPGDETTADPDEATANPFVLGDTTRATGSRIVEQGGVVTGTVSQAAAASRFRSTAAAGDPFPGACVGAVPDGTMRIVASDTTDAAGDYTLSGLAPGQSYRVVAHDCQFPRRFGLAWATNAVIAGEAVPVTVTAGQVVTGRNIRVGDVVQRAADQNRVLTAVEFARGAFDEAATVVLTRSDEYPDALAGAPLAAARNAPILLTPPSGLDPAVADTIESLGAARVVLLGGPQALSTAVEQQVRRVPGVTTVERIQGENRFATAAAIAARLPASDRAYVVEGAHADPGRGWPDAVSVAGLAAFERTPLLLVSRDTYPAPTKQALATRGVDHVTIVGGPSAVSAAVAAAIDGDVGTTERVFGADRYATSEAVVQRALAAGAWSRTLWLATGTDFPDALVAGAVVGQDGGILKLVHGPDGAASPTFAGPLAERARHTDRVVLMGGPAAISPATAAAVEEALSLD